MRADLLVNRAFQPFCFFRNRSFEGRSKPPGKPRGYPSTQSSDSIEARKLTDPTVRSKKLFQTLAPNKTPKTPSPKPVGPARLRARRRYTRRSSNWQAPFHKKSKNLNEPESAAPHLWRPSRMRAVLFVRPQAQERRNFHPRRMTNGRILSLERRQHSSARCFLPHFATPRLRRNIKRGIRAAVRKVSPCPTAPPSLRS